IPGIKPSGMARTSSWMALPSSQDSIPPCAISSASHPEAALGQVLHPRDKLVIGELSHRGKHVRVHGLYPSTTGPPGPLEPDPPHLECPPAALSRGPPRRRSRWRELEPAASSPDRRAPPSSPRRPGRWRPAGGPGGG